MEVYKGWLLISAILVGVSALYVGVTYSLGIITQLILDKEHLIADFGVNTTLGMYMLMPLIMIIAAIFAVIYGVWKCYKDSKQSLGYTTIV